MTIRNDHLGIIQLNMGISDCHVQLQKRNYSVPDSILTYWICAFASECFVFLQPAEELPCSLRCVRRPPRPARLERCAAAGFEDAAAFGRSEAAGANLEPRATMRASLGWISRFWQNRKIPAGAKFRMNGLSLF